MTLTLTEAVESEWELAEFRWQLSRSEFSAVLRIEVEF
jgi:hypothetical protein